MTDLKDCPFCGGDAQHNSDDNSPAQWIECKKCGARGKVTGYGAGEDPAALWNTRPEEDELQHSFDLDWNCSRRATKLWQEAHPGNDLVWPDKARLMVWLMEQYDHLLKFKAFVHKRLDDAGVPADPPGEHRDAGCRIGQRLDWLFSQKTP